MNKNLFPPEIINHTTESHFVKHSTKSKIIYLTVVVAIITTIALLPFISIDVTTQMRGIIRTPSENNQLQVAVYGEISQMYIAENKQVNKGDTLVVIKYDKIDEEISVNEEKMAENNTFINDIDFLLNNQKTSVTTSKYLTESNVYAARQNEQQTKIDYLLNEYKRSEFLWNKKVMPKQKYLQCKNNYETALNQEKNIKEQFYNNWQAEKTRLKLQNIELKSAIKQLVEEKTKYIIKAPYTGSIIQFNGMQAGNFIGPGQTIAYISSNDHLLVECYISPSDIGFIQKEQSVVFQLDAFNYNQWGMAHGEVQEISNDITSINDQPVFRVRCTLNDEYLQLKNGYKGNLKKGMTLTGSFFLTKRTLWQLLFDKVDNWMNPKVILSREIGA